MSVKSRMLIARAERSHNIMAQKRRGLACRTIMFSVLLESIRDWQLFSQDNGPPNFLCTSLGDLISIFIFMNLSPHRPFFMKIKRIVKNPREIIIELFTPWLQFLTRKVNNVVQVGPYYFTVTGRFCISVKQSI